MARRPKPWFWRARAGWFVTLDGDRVSLGPDKKQAFDRFYELMRQPARSRKFDSRSLVAVIDSFLEWVQNHRSPHTYEWYRYRLERLAQKYPDLQTGELKPYHVQQWVDGYPDLSRTSRRNYLRSIKRCLRWAKKMGYVNVNPIEELEVPDADRKEVLVTTDQFELLLANIPDPNFSDLVVTTWETGCRPQESLRVEARHVDLKNRRWVFPKSESKGKRKPRIVYLAGRALEITKRLVQQHPEGKLFRNNRGLHWTKDSVNCAFDRARIRFGKKTLSESELAVSNEEIDQFIPTLRKLRLEKGHERIKTSAELREEAKRKLASRKIVEMVPRFSLYALRHSWATRALQSGLDGLTVAILMGHSDPSTLARVYQHLSHNPEHLLTQANKVQR